MSETSNQLPQFSNFIEPETRKWNKKLSDKEKQMHWLRQKKYLEKWKLQEEQKASSIEDLRKENLFLKSKIEILEREIERIKQNSIE